jgi:hypothetical protein
MADHAASAAALAPAAPLSRRRRIAVWTLLVLASVLAVVSILTTWVERQMLDDHAWRTATTDVIQDPQVQAALSTYLVNQLYDRIDVGAALQQRLPSNLKPLGPPIAGALRDPAERGVETLLQRPRLQQVWIGASAVAHEKLVNVLENKTGFGISTGSGVVTLNLHDLIVELGLDLGLPADALARVPPNAGVITLMSSKQLAAVQDGVRIVRILSVWLLVLVLAMYGLAIYLARGMRRETLRNVGWALVLVGLVVVVVRRLLGNYIVDSLASPGYDASTHRLWLIGTSILGQIGAATILYGVVVVIAAVLAGPTRAATSARRWIAPVLNDRPGLAWGIVAAVYLLVIYWGGTHALRTGWGILLLAALIAFGVVVLRRQTLREFPAETREPHRPLHEWAAALRAETRHAAPAPATAPSTRSAAEEIALLRDLQESGAITAEEFERGKELALT